MSLPNLYKENAKKKAVEAAKTGYLDVSVRYLETLPPLPSNLKVLVCKNNQLLRLPDLPTGLVSLDCAKNELLALPELPSTLETLLCGRNQLQSIPSVPKTLRSLDCHMNKISYLPELNEGLINLSCASNELRSIPELPSTLKYFACGANPLQSLPSLPNGLVQLYCNHTKLSTLPDLPKTLLVLECGANELTKLPLLPPGLVRLECRRNKLETLPPLPTTLEFFECDPTGFVGPFKVLVEHLYQDRAKVEKDVKEKYGYNKRYEGIQYKETEQKRLLAQFIKDVNKIYERGQGLKEELVAYKYDPKRIEANLKRNQINMNQALSEKNYNKYFTRRGEVWTEGISTAPGPWPKNMGIEARKRWSRFGKGGKTRRRRLNKSSKKH